ncbi:hypothetical protein D9758_008764 [Tetrapyrgos nigripes]|uniref:Uncharacterized protein n=1 Tax=Tetrapyrgos nigripes TaxID=182062 RepID=A0A8H5FY61_9AGAR|nr:hypothetical protein D9758_008764 [Tetrapyrgos nigripes]
MHGGIQDFTAKGIYNVLSAICDLTAAIPVRMPSLTSVTLDFYPSDRYIPPIAPLLRSLPQLSKIALPSFTDVSPILLALKSSTKLQRLCFNSGTPYNKAVEETWRQLGDSIFTAVEDLYIRVRQYSSIYPFFQEHPLQNLRVLTVLTIQNEEPSSVRNLFQIIPTFSPNLVELKVSYSHESEFFEISVTPPEDEIVTFADFRAVLACPNITRFTLLHAYPLGLTDSDVEEIAIAWPRLRTLRLCNEGYLRRHWRLSSKPTLHALFTLIRHCPELEEVGLFMDTKPLSSATLASLANTDTEFAMLKKLFLQGSPPERQDTYRLAMSLSQFCHPSCTLEWMEWNFTVDEEMTHSWRMVEEMLAASTVPPTAR